MYVGIDGEKIMMVAVLSILSQYQNVRPLVMKHFRHHATYLLEKVTERMYDANPGTRAKEVLAIGICMVMCPDYWLCRWRGAWQRWCFPTCAHMCIYIATHRC